MKIIKLSTPWHHEFYSQTPQGKGEYGSYKFEIDNDCKECDYWVIWGGLKERTQVKCQPNCVFYLTDETHNQRFFNKGFLNQFFAVFTPRDDVKHENVIKTHDLGIWHFKNNYEDIMEVTTSKQKRVSAVASDLTWLPGHKKRFAFINQLIGHYKSNIDFFGRGINPIENKIEALQPYEYSIAIENSFVKDYFTEKLFECFLTYTLPIYYGCPNLEKYFHEKCFLRIDIDDLEGTIEVIDDAIKSDLYKERIEFVREAKRQFLNEYHAFPSLIRLINSNFSNISTRRKKLCTIKKESQFTTSFSKKALTYISKVW